MSIKEFIELAEETNPSLDTFQEIALLVAVSSETTQTLESFRPESIKAVTENEDSYKQALREALLFIAEQNEVSLKGDS